ncbi:MAG: Ig-like domain-containing protein, partial [Methanosphaera sp.]|nr:Ig-like domain-containing protein [Methanosphaera sp.]
FNINVTVDENFPEEILIGDEITITGSATLQNNTLKNNPIVLTIDGTKYTTSTDEEGKYSYTYTAARNGTIAITANATFTNAAITLGQTSFFVAKPTVNIDIDELSDTLSLTPISLDGRIYIAQNNTGIGTDLLLTINGIESTLTSDEDGYFTYTFTPDSVGVYEISIEYENIRYEIHNALATITVNKRETQLVNDKLPIAVQLNEAFPITGRLIDEKNSPVDNAEVIFIINDETYINTTDSDGYYAFNYQTTNIQDNNLYEVRYYGDDDYFLSRNYVGSFFDVELIDAIITIDITNNILNEPITITGTVTDSKNNALSDIHVIIEISDNQYERTTNDEGIYELTFTPTKLGKYNVTATINEENYIPNKATTEFNVGKMQTTTTISPVKVTPTLDANLTATVVDSNNNPVTTGKVVFKINGKTVKDENGKVIYTKIVDQKAVLAHRFTESDLGQNVSISASYSGTTYYEPSTSDKVNIITSDDHNVIMTLNDITAMKTETVTITATLTDNDENINIGKVVFKINGKT